MALILSLLRGLAPLLVMLDTAGMWPFVGAARSGWLSVEEQPPTGLDATLPSPLGCYVSIGNDVLGYSTTNGEQRRLVISDAELNRLSRRCFSMDGGQFAGTRRRVLFSAGEEQNIIK